MGRYRKYLSALLGVLPLLSCERSALEMPARRDLSFVAYTPEVKSTYIPSTTLGTLPLYVSAAYRKDGAAMQFLSNRTFSRGGDDRYHASPGVYWPFDGTLDFLAYAGTDAALSGSGNPSIAWETLPSEGAVITFTNTKTAGVDLVWATANGQSPQDAPVALAFSHALARLEIQVRATGLSGGKLRLKSVVLQTSPEDRLALGGTFTIDNTRNVPTGTWSALNTLSDYGFFTGQNITFGADGLTSLVGLLNGTARKAKEEVLVPLANMYVPEQGNKNLVVTYSLDGAADTVETVNLVRDIWRRGKTYTYQLVFDGSAGLEIVYNPPFGPGPEENW